MDYNQMRRILSLSILSILMLANVCLAAVGCTLNDPDRDIKRVFPDFTGYRTDFITIEEVGGIELRKRIEERLGDKFDSIYETIDTPYAYYTILKGKETIGRMHGVNQKGFYGGMQLILSTDLKGRIVDFYFQKISSPEAKAFRDETFTSLFTGKDLADFDEGGRIEGITDPTERSGEDFIAALRGIKKNLILLDEFILSKSGLKNNSKGGDHEK